MAKPSGGAFVGLDIGSQTIKAVEARGAGSNLQISALGIENTPPGAIQGGIVADPKALGAAIKALLAKSGIGAKRSVSAATGAASVVVRVIEVPRMTPAELAETMKWEVERHIPFAANDVEMAYQPIDDPVAAADPNSVNMEVLLAVAQRDMVATHIETLQAAGLNPVAVDVEPLAVGRALINLSKADLAAKNVVVVNIGASATDVGIFKSGILRFPRTIPIAGDNFTRAISDHLGLGMETAEEEKRENAAIFLDLIAGGGTPDFGLDDAANTAPAGRTPFDFSSEVPPSTPFADPTAASPFADPPSPAASPFDLSEETTASPSPFDLNDEPASTASMSSIGGGGGGSADDPGYNPFATPPPAPDPSPFGSAPAAAAGPPAAIPEDARTRRRRELFDALLPVLGEFEAEVRRSVDYFRSRYPSDTVDQILLCGGSARIPNLDQFLETQLGIPTVVADPFATIKVSSRQMSSERLQEVAPAFAVAVGLATRDALMGPDKK